MKFSIISPILFGLVVPSVLASYDPLHPTFETGAFSRQALASYPAQTAHFGSATRKVPAATVVIDYAVKYSSGHAKFSIGGLTVNHAKLHPVVHQAQVKSVRVTWLKNVPKDSYAVKVYATFVYTIDGVTYGFGGSWTDVITGVSDGQGQTMWQSKLDDFAFTTTVGIGYHGATLDLQPSISNAFQRLAYVAAASTMPA